MALRLLHWVLPVAVIVDTSMNCVVCKKEKHPLYACGKFKALSHDSKVSVIHKTVQLYTVVIMCSHMMPAI